MHLTSWQAEKPSIESSPGRERSLVGRPNSQALVKSSSPLVVHALQVAAERRRKAATRPLPLADSAAAALEPGPPAAHDATATGETVLNGGSSTPAEQGQKVHAQSDRHDGAIPEPRHHSSPPEGAEKALTCAEAYSAKQEALEGLKKKLKELRSSASAKAHSALPALESHSEQDKAGEELDCNGFHDDANAESLKQEEGPSSSDIPPAESKDSQQPAMGPTPGAASIAAVQERQQRLMQTLIEGCDDLAEDHQQVCIAH